MSVHLWEVIGESARFSYHVIHTRYTKQWGIHEVKYEGQSVTLRDAKLGEERVFFLANGQGVGIHSHMKSLTDDLLASWFEKKKVKKEKKDGPKSSDVVAGNRVLTDRLVTVYVLSAETGSSGGERTVGEREVPSEPTGQGDSQA